MCMRDSKSVCLCVYVWCVRESVEESVYVFL